VAYRAEIEIGVRGTEKLRDLRNTITNLNEGIVRLNDLANTFNAPIQSLANYNISLKIAVDNLNKVELGTKDAADAIDTYVRALGDRNEAEYKVNKAIADRIKLLEEEARVQKLTAAGVFETTRFKQPIGPARPSGVVPAGGFPVSGPLQSPGFQGTQKQVGKFGENLALGAGFPLLFGGGPGSVAGSVLGSFVGSGFGGQILGGALGAIIDQTVTKVAALGTAIQQLDFKTLESSGIRLTAELQTQVQLLRQVGDATQARKVVEGEILNITGAVPGTIVGISDAVNLLTSAWTDFTASIGVTVGIIGAPLAAALAAVLNTVNLILKGFNTLLSLLAAGIKAVGEWVVTLTAGQQALKAINDILKSNNQEIQNARAEYQPILSDLNSQVLLNREILNIEKQKRSPNTAADKEYNSVLTERQNIIRINAQYDEEIRKQNEKITEANKAQVEQAIRLLNVKRNQAIEETQVRKNLEQQNLAYQAQQAALRAAKAAATEQDRVQKAIANTQKEILQTGLERVNVQYDLDTLARGEYAVLKDRIANAQKELDVRNAILQKEEEAALAAAKTPGEEAVVIRLYQEKARLLSDQANYQNTLNYNRAIELKYTKDILAIQNKGAVRKASFSAQADIATARQNLEKSTGGTGFGFAQQELAAQQAARRSELDLQMQLVARMQQQLPKLEGDAATAMQTAIAQQTDLNAIELNRIETLTALEQQQLRVNQVTEQYGPIASSIGDAFGTSFKGIVDGTMTAQQALASFFQSVASSFLDMAAKIIAKWIEMTILNSILRIFPGGGLAGSGGAGFDMGSLNGVGMAGFNPGNSFNLAGRAAGGPVSAGMPYMVGEKGPELFLPRSSGTIIPNNALSAGTTNVVVNVDASGNSNIQGDQAQGKQLGLVVSAAVQAELIKQQRPGGLLAGTRR